MLDELKTLATPEAVMDDTAFGAVPMRQALSNTLWGSDATIKTWVKWMCDDGSQAGSLWTWAGESQPGEPFELIGVNLDDFDDEVRVTYSLVDWPYDRADVRESFAFIDEAELLALRLEEAGIEVTLDSYPGGHTTANKVPELVGYLTEAASAD